MRGVASAVVAVVALLAVGCATQGPDDLRARLAPLVGQSEAEVVRRMGPPARTDPGPVLRYVVNWPYVGGPNFTVGYDQPLGRQCDIALRFVDGRLAAFDVTGSVCGMGGLPYIAP